MTLAYTDRESRDADIRRAIESQIKQLCVRGGNGSIFPVPDPYLLSPEDQEAADEIFDAALRETMDFIAAGKPNPSVFLDEARYPALPAWMNVRKLAIALLPVYRPDRTEFLGSGLTIDDLLAPFPWGRTPQEELAAAAGAERAARLTDRYRVFLTTRRSRVIQMCLRGHRDARAIRTRAIAATELVLERSSRWQQAVRIASLACGAAHPVARLSEQLKDRGIPVASVSLLDHDPLALAAGRSVVAQEAPGLHLNVFLTGLLDRRRLRAADLRPHLGAASQHIVEMIGLFEYLPDMMAVDLLRRIREVLAPGALVLFGNMLRPRPGQESFEHVIRWPALFQRSIFELADLVQSAGYPMEQLTVAVPDDCVYQVALIDTAL